MRINRSESKIGRPKQYDDLTIAKLHLTVSDECTKSGISRRKALQKLHDTGVIRNLLSDDNGRYRLERYLTPKYLPDFAGDWLWEKSQRVGITSLVKGFSKHQPF